MRCQRRVLGDKSHDEVIHDSAVLLEKEGRETRGRVIIPRVPGYDKKKKEKLEKVMSNKYSEVGGKG